MQKIKFLELLAPAQNKECAYDAINYGADSVYIGANLFGARKNAGNSLEDIKEVIDYAHKFGAKVYITLNTILDNNELQEATKIIHKLYNLKADGIIFQDFGILNEALCEALPDIKLIASTQCDNRDIKKVKFFEKIGIKRVILARELSLEQIKEISKNTDVELESFIHGALCVSYSGQCYLSYKIGGRSANRGECGQACRKKYSLINDKGTILEKDKYLLSMKDFMAAQKLENLIDAGVTSFKIEGRLKDSFYIKNTVLYYRKILDGIIEKRKNEGFKRVSSGKIFSDFIPNPTKSFNRDFCEYFLDKRKPLNKEKIFNFDTPNSKGEFLGYIHKVEKNYFILDKNRVEISAQDGLCYIDKNGTLKGFLVNSYKDGKIFPNVAQDLKNGTKIYRNKDSAFYNILKNSKTKRRIGVEFYIKDGIFEAKDEDKNIVSINFSGEIAKNPEKARESWISALQKTGESDFYLEKITFETENIYFLSTSKLNELRRNILEKLMQKKLKNYKTERQDKIKTAQYPETSGDYRLNVHNKMAEEFFKKCGCNVKEYSLESSSSIAKNRELMRTKHCIRHSLGICLKNTKNNDKLFLKDEFGEKYALEFDCKNCEMVIKSL